MSWSPLDPTEIGHAAQVGRMRPDHGVDFADVQCDNCSATWVGLVGDECTWCAEKVEALPEHDRLAASEDPDDQLRSMLVDWTEFWQANFADEAWIVEPIIPEGRSAAIFAPGGTGKSLLTLWLVAHVAVGLDPFTRRKVPPRHVLYLDYEMTGADLIERLERFGFDESTDLSHLHYALLPSLDGLDRPDGGRDVVRLAEIVEAELVVIDTFGRAVHGDENEADTVRSWYRWTGLHLKAAGRAFIRVDHAGKDAERGQRGSSAKNDDVDIVWQMSIGEGATMALKRRKARMGWVPPEVGLEIVQDDESLTYRLTKEPVWQAGTPDKAREMDELHIGLDLSNRAAQTAFRLAGGHGKNALINSAQKYRRLRSTTFHFAGDRPAEWTGIAAQTAGITPSGVNGDQPGGPHDESPGNIEGTTSGITGDHHSSVCGDHSPTRSVGESPTPADEGKF